MRILGFAAAGLFLAYSISATALDHIHFRDERQQHAQKLRGRDTAVTDATPTATATQSWDVQVEAACSSQIARLNGVASNPAGLAVCYNVPAMDNSTGIFEAELRMYSLSAPTGDWKGVSSSDMMVSLAYLGATVQIKGTMGTGETSTSAAKRVIYQPETESRGAPRLSSRDPAVAPKALTVLRYVGQLNRNVRGPQFDMPQIQSLLIPELELSATNPVTNERMETVLSTSEASFLMGVFSDAGTMTFTPASVGSATAAANSVVPFVMPGMRIQIAPVGLVVTMVWVGFFVGVVGLGTVRRIQFRDQYRRRLQRQIGNAMKGT